MAVKAALAGDGRAVVSGLVITSSSALFSSSSRGLIASLPPGVRLAPGPGGGRLLERGRTKGDAPRGAPATTPRGDKLRTALLLVGAPSVGVLLRGEV